jgi:hypothetical protein
MRDGKNNVESAMTRSEAIRFADRHPHLNRAQKTVVEDVLSARDHIHGIQGFAGAGKTIGLPLQAALGFRQTKTRVRVPIANRASATMGDARSHALARLWQP